LDAPNEEALASDLYDHRLLMRPALRRINLKTANIPRWLADRFNCRLKTAPRRPKRIRGFFL